ncbi:hypothetical protein BN7_5523 [Wickerhamomyces ciferrii]|uniref:Zn(2)-C6 fungal-type domain-containing protein n=1 Tax=Wickerhamomyces ciferrii (strain ATCC 14091 / BCRC 22168 / CBS 111 / JCM 3599 / NBRC 0793 / NRRL Y-1031 F-60-10) TaxID=1206466 RepID=K0KS01_WICCF|nr:uncharacterized protein BN7_5523 [Wickerhamomyces ciferrii]CCH45936.1 hypothetical protein BN7_5523 [Wickerhamomyces ciferrii]
MGPKEAVKEEVDTPQPKPVNRRRAAACKSCHTLKVKCIPSDPNDLSSPCVRCIKTKRKCEIESNQNRKKKKNLQISLPEIEYVQKSNLFVFDELNTNARYSRVTELEQKIEKLNAELLQHKSQMSISPHNASHNGYQSGVNSPIHLDPISHPQPQNYQPSNLGQSLSAASTTPDESNKPSKRNAFEFVNETEKLRKKNGENIKKPRKLTKAEQLEQLMGPNSLSEISTVATKVAEDRVKMLKSPHVDLIDRGLLTVEEAQERLDQYVNKLYAKYPFVDVPTNLEEFRREYPVLFNAVMAITCAVIVSDDLDKNLEIENIATQQVIHEIVLIGNKSIELLKAAVLLTVWYIMPELFHHRRYHILSILCITLTQDLGLTGRPYYVVNKSEGSVQRSTVLEDPQKDEYKCMVLVVYSTSVGYSLFLRRRIMATWSPYLEECYQQLRVSPIIKNRTVAVFAKLSSLLEKIHSFVQAKDQENLPFIEHFQRSIDFLKFETTTMDSDVLLGYAYSVEAFLYSKFTAIDLSYKCLHSASKCLEHFGALTPDQTSYIPHVIYGRLMYAFALQLKTSSYLKYDFDLNAIKKNINILNECNKIYKVNHLLLKAKLLFYFYLTTYAKNENAFNELATESPADTAFRSVSEHLTPSSTHADSPHQSSSKTNENIDSTPQYYGPPGSQQQTPSHPHQSLPQSNPGIPPQGQFQPPLPVQQYSHQQHLNPMGMPNHFNGQNPSPYSQQPMPPGNFAPPPPPLHHVNSFTGFPSNSASSRELLESQMEPSYPQIDMLSEATIKGFGDVPTELMGQDEFWRLFDHKDEQFLL